MQHHPGSWYLPWGVPLQKMLVPMHPQAAAAAASFHPHSHPHPQQPQPQSTFQLTSVQQQPLGQHQQAQQQAQHHQTQYQTHIHPAFNHQQMHPAAAAAAAAMFTPLSLRTFLGPTTHGLLNQAGLPQPQPTNTSPLSNQTNTQISTMNLNVGVIPIRHTTNSTSLQQQTISKIPTSHTHNGSPGSLLMPINKKTIIMAVDKEKNKMPVSEKRKSDEGEQMKDLKKAKLETKALKAKRPGFTDERYHETSYYIENGLRKVYPYYFTFTTFTKGRWVGEKILDVFAREFRAHPAEEYERCILAGKLTVNYEKVPTDYRLKHNDLLANIVHRHEVPVTSQPITIVHMDDDIVVVNKPASIPVHPCGRYRHNTVVFILAKEYNLKNLRTIHRLDRLTSGLLLFGRSPKKARQMEHQIRNRQVQKEYVCRVEGEFPEGVIECKEPIEVVSYKIGVCKVSSKGKECTTTFEKIGFNGKSSVVLCKPRTGRMHQIRVHLQYLGYPVINDPLYNHEVFGPAKGKGGDIGGKTDEQLVKDLINIHNAENWLGIDGDSDLSLFKSLKSDPDEAIQLSNNKGGGNPLSDDDSESVSRETSPCSESPRPQSVQGSDSPQRAQLSLLAQQQQFSPQLEPSVSPPVAAAPTMTSTATTTEGLIPGFGGGQTGHSVGHTTSSTFYNNLISTNSLTMRNKSKVTVATQTGHESPDLAFNLDKMTTDKHCYECKVRYRDPKPQDLVMYLHAWKYKGIGWEYETDLPDWASSEWLDEKSSD